VALVPDTVARLTRKGLEVVVERGAGEGAFFEDGEYVSSGGHLGTRQEVFNADVVVKVAPPDEEEIGLLQRGGVLIGFLSPLDEPGITANLAERGVTAVSMELVPRISRAQKMDALSAMSAVAG